MSQAQWGLTEHVKIIELWCVSFWRSDPEKDLVKAKSSADKHLLFDFRENRTLMCPDVLAKSLPDWVLSQRSHDLLVEGCEGSSHFVLWVAFLLFRVLPFPFPFKFATRILTCCNIKFMKKEKRKCMGVVLLTYWLLFSVIEKELHNLVNVNRFISRGNHQRFEGADEAEHVL